MGGPINHILITGVAGFIGSNLAEKLLKEGYQVTGIDNFDPFYPRLMKEGNLHALIGSPQFRFIEMDIRLKDDFKRITSIPDLVIHLAAKPGVVPSVKDPHGYIETNILGTQNLLDWMTTQSIDKLIFASSSSIYGNHHETPFRENMVLDRPISPYAFTKKSGELQTYTWHYLNHTSVINLRFFTVFGPRQRPDLAIHNFFNLVSQGKTIVQYGDGSSKRDYTYIDDIVDGIFRCVDFLKDRNRTYEILNLGNNNPVSLDDLIELVGKALGKSPKIEVMEMRPGEVEVTWADISKAKSMLNWEPHTAIELGIEKFKSWYLEQALNPTSTS